MNLTKKFFCPVNAWECPYWHKGGFCSIGDPIMDCDDAAYFYGDDEENPYVWEDENGNRYDEQELLEMGYHFVNGEPVVPTFFGYEKWSEVIERLWGGTST